MSVCFSRLPPRKSDQHFAICSRGVLLGLFWVGDMINPWAGFGKLGTRRGDRDASTALPPALRTATPFSMTDQKKNQFVGVKKERAARRVGVLVFGSRR